MSLTDADRVERRDRWEQATRVFLLVVGVAFIVAYSLVVLVPDMAPGWRIVAAVVLAFAWFAFLVDYLVRLLLTPGGRRWAFVRANAIDLLSVILPVFRAFRVVSLLSGIPYFRTRTPAAVRAEIAVVAGGYAVIFVYFLALATLQAERDAPGATITSFGDAVWWACVTLATVGYGDTYPVTVAGRICAVLLMAGGIAIVGTTSAVVISYLGERVRDLRHADRNEDAR